MGAAQLQRQVRNLQERNAALREQMRTTKGVKTDAKKTAAYAKEFRPAVLFSSARREGQPIDNRCRRA